jgi:hypothetical protein
MKYPLPLLAPLVRVVVSRPATKNQAFGDDRAC